MLGARCILLVRKLMSCTSRNFLELFLWWFPLLHIFFAFSFQLLDLLNLFTLFLPFLSFFPYFSFFSISWRFPDFYLLILLLSFPSCCHILISKSSFVVVILWVFLFWKIVSCSIISLRIPTRVPLKFSSSSESLFLPPGCLLCGSLFRVWGKMSGDPQI